MRTPTSLTNQFDYKNTHYKARKRLSRLDRKIYRISQGTNGTRQRTFRTLLNATTAAANQQIVVSASLAGYSLAATTFGDISRILTLEGLTQGSDTNIYLRTSHLTINMRNGTGGSTPREQVHTIYKLRAVKRFAGAIETTIGNIFQSANSVGPLLTNNHWTPFMAVDKLSQYGISIVDVTKYTINSGEFISYTDKVHYGSKKISTELNNAQGDNEPGLTYHYMVIVQDTVGDTNAFNLAMNVEFVKKYTYQVEGTPDAESTVTYL